MACFRYRDDEKKYEKAEVKVKARMIVMNSEEMRKSRLSIGTIAIILLAVAFPSQSIFAAPVSRTTSQQWTFTSPPGQVGTDGLYGPFDPVTYSNDFGKPQLYVGGRAAWGNNAWSLKNDEMDIFIKNYPDNSSGTSKIITVELTWLEGGFIALMPDMPTIATLPTLSLLSQTNSTSDGWKTTTFTITINPNPLDEVLMIKGDIVLKEVSVTTQCIPEPATLGLLIGGAFMAFRRSRSKIRKETN
jgi:hypothetical protein